MHLDNELKALRPDVGRPSPTVVAGHRRVLDAAIAEGRTGPLRHPGGGQVRRLVAVAAVLAVVVAGGVGWWAAARGDDVRLDTGPAGTPATSSDPTSTTQPATTALGAAAGPAGTGDQSTPTVTFAPGAGLACGPGTPTGDSLPAFVQLLPDDPDATAGPGTFDADGHLVTRRENGQFAVEALWPAPERQLYAADAEPNAPATTSFGNYSLHSTTGGETADMVVEQQTGDVTALRILTSGSVNVSDQCRYVLVTVFDRGEPIARFTYDLAADAGGAGMVDRGPLVVETRQVAEAPTEATPCGGAGATGVPPNRAETPRGPVAPTPAGALDAYLATPEADFYYHSGYVEMITPDGTYTYGARFDGDASQWVTLVTVTPVDGGWAVTHLNSSGC